VSNEVADVGWRLRTSLIVIVPVRVFDGVWLNHVDWQQLSGVVPPGSGKVVS
jgi:hypothetical protein